MPIEKINTNLCIGCGTCVATCPMDVIRMDKDGEKAVIVYQEDCQICHLCRIYCPVDDVITISSTKCVRPMVGWA